MVNRQRFAAYFLPLPPRVCAYLAKEDTLGLCLIYRALDEAASDYFVT